MTDRVECVIQEYRAKGLTKEEIDLIVDQECKKSSKRWKISLLLVIIYLLLAYFLFQLGSIQRLVNFLLRILLFKIKPFWDWSYVDTTGCLVANPFYKQPSQLSRVNCYSCQDLRGLQKQSSISDGDLEYHLLSGVPLVYSNQLSIELELSQWKASKVDETELIKEYSKLKDFDTCELVSNLLAREPRNVFEWATKSPNSSWFIHWENCSERSKRFARGFFQRPKTLPSYIDLSPPSWVLLSGKMSAFTWKTVALPYSVSIGVVIQIKGQNMIRLDPVNYCRISGCEGLEFSLNTSEILIYNAELWDLRYRPYKSHFNYAIIITGIHEPLS